MNPALSAASIVFLTNFLGLVTGRHTVVLEISGPVASIELTLDSELVGRASQEPWSIPCDFGTELRPHLLEARAVDTSGKTLASCRQWINLHRMDAEASLAFDRNEAG